MGGYITKAGMWGYRAVRVTVKMRHVYVVPTKALAKKILSGKIAPKKYHVYSTRVKKRRR